MAIQIEPRMTVADYVEWEERHEFKHDYIDGEVIEMSGGSGNHSKIAMNIALALGRLVDVLEFVFHSSNMRVRISKNRYVYPDLSLVRHAEQYEDDKQLSLLNPVFVVEVTSPSSNTYDRVDKLGFYLEVPSIEAYLIIDQDRIRADLCNRTEAGWYVRVFNRPDDTLPLDALGCDLPLADVYRGIEFSDLNG